MSGRTISGTITGRVTLTPGDNPVSVVSGTTVTGPGGIYGPAATNWTISNQGKVAGTSNAGIYLAQGGTVANQSAGSISGLVNGVLIAGDLGTIVNSGTISETTMGGAAVSMTDGGLLANNASTAAIAANSIGVYITGLSGTITNSGSITSNQFPVYLKSAGVISNAATGLIQGGYGIKVYSAGTTITNLGTIDATATVGAAFGVYLRNGGRIINGNGGPSAAVIQSYYGLAFKSVVTSSLYASDVTNYGKIVATGASSTAIDLTNDGTVVNGPSNATNALIQGGRWGVYGAHGIRLTNFGTVDATGSVGNDAGVFVQAQAGTVSNLGSAALLEGNYGVYLAASGTVTNAGTIASTQPGVGDAVRFASGGLLVVEPGAVFIGTVVGGSGTMELAGTASGTLSGLGTNFTGFDTITVDPGASWNITGYNAVSSGVTIAVGHNAGLALTGSLVGAGAFVLTGGTLDLVNGVDPGASFNFADPAGTAVDLLTVGNAGSYSFDNAITGFSRQDQIVLPGLSFAAGSTAAISGSSVTVDLQAGGTFTFSNINFQAGSPQAITVGADFIMDPTCFVAGTQVRTERGQTRIEDIRPGDCIHGLVGERSQPVIWIGRRAIDCTRHPKPRLVWPVRITAGAFGTARPCRDLWLSPNHAIFMGGVLIPVKYLINGSSITQVSVTDVIYYHLELPRHDVVLAEGLPAESYLDLGDRTSFEDGGPVTLYPGFAERWDAGGCAPLTITGPALTAARSWVNALAGAAIAA